MATQTQRRLQEITGVVLAVNERGLKLEPDHGGEPGWLNLSQFASREARLALQHVARGMSLTVAVDKDGFIRELSSPDGLDLSGSTNALPPEPAPAPQPAQPKPQAQPPAQPAATAAQPQRPLSVQVSVQELAATLGAIERPEQQALIVAQSSLRTALDLLKNGHRPTPPEVMALAEQLERWVWAAPARLSAMVNEEEEPF